MQKNSQPDDASEISNDGSRKWRKADEINVGGRFSYYLVPCHPCVDKHPKQMEFDVNIVALMAHAFTLLSLVDHNFFPQADTGSWPAPLPFWAIKTVAESHTQKKQLVEKSVIERLYQQET